MCGPPYPDRNVDVRLDAAHGGFAVARGSGVVDSKRHEPEGADPRFPPCLREYALHMPGRSQAALSFRGGDRGRQRQSIFHQAVASEPTGEREWMKAGERGGKRFRPAQGVIRRLYGMDGRVAQQVELSERLQIGRLQ